MPSIPAAAVAAPAAFRDSRRGIWGGGSGLSQVSIRSSSRQGVGVRSVRWLVGLLVPPGEQACQEDWPRERARQLVAGHHLAGEILTEAPLLVDARREHQLAQAAALE